VTWRTDAVKAWVDKQAETAAADLVEEQRKGLLLGELLSIILEEPIEATSSEYSDLGVTFVLRREVGGRDLVAIVGPLSENEVNNLADVGRILDAQGL